MNPATTPGFASSGGRSSMSTASLEHATGNAGPVPNLNRDAPLPKVGGEHDTSVGDMLYAAQDKAQEWAHSAASSLQSGWDATSRQARQLASNVASATDECCESVSGFVRRHPFASLGM